LANSDIYGIDFSNFDGRWYSVNQLTSIIDNAVSIHANYLLMKDPVVNEPIGRFSTDQLALGQFKTVEVFTSKQMSGIIAMRLYDEFLKERGAVL